MNHDAERAEELINKLRKLKGLCPMSPEEADAAYDASPSIPIAGDKIRSIIESVTSGDLTSWKLIPNRGTSEMELGNLEKDVKLLEWSDWAQRFPLKEMKRLRFSLPAGSSDVDVLLKFFAVPSPQSWRSVWKASSAAYRQTRIFTMREESIAAWVREAEVVASGLDVTDFDEQRLRSSLGELRQLTRKPADQIMDPIQSICAGAGVAVVLVPELPHTSISGCARWLTDKRALVGLTLRYKTEDQLWFTFFHELGHILLHRYTRSFVIDNAADDLADHIVDPAMEQYEAEANRFAADTLIPPSALDDFIRRQTFTSESIHDFAEAIGVGPGIVVGRLQHDGILEHYQGNTLKQKLDYGFATEE